MTEPTESQGAPRQLQLDYSTPRKKDRTPEIVAYCFAVPALLWTIFVQVSGVVALNNNHSDMFGFGAIMVFAFWGAGTVIGLVGSLVSLGFTSGIDAKNPRALAIVATLLNGVAIVTLVTMLVISRYRAG